MLEHKVLIIDADPSKRNFRGLVLMCAMSNQAITSALSTTSRLKKSF
jgi:hypothetical protein